MKKQRKQDYFRQRQQYTHVYIHTHIYIYIYIYIYRYFRNRVNNKTYNGGTFFKKEEDTRTLFFLPKTPIIDWMCLFF